MLDQEYLPIMYQVDISIKAMPIMDQVASYEDVQRNIKRMRY